MGLQITPEMEAAKRKLDQIVWNDEYTKYDLPVINKLLGLTYDPVYPLRRLAEGAYRKNFITIYEAFQLAEVYYRYTYGSCGFVPPYLNMALMAKLFEEEEMYKAFSADCIRIRDNLLAYYKKNYKKYNKAKPFKFGHYIYDDVEGFLSADREHMEILSYKNHHIHGAARMGADDYHFSCFPHDVFCYEDEFLKIYNGEMERYPVDKNMSPVVCDIIATVEIRMYELKDVYK